MDERDDRPGQDQNFAKYWDVVCRRRWWLLLPAFTVWAAVWNVSWILPVIYRSETVILVEQQKVPEQYVVANVSALQERLQSLTEQILSRTRLLHIMDQLHLYEEQNSHATVDELIERMRADIQIELIQSPNRRGDVAAFKVAYLCRDPVLAQQVTSQLTSLFMQENLQVREQQSENTTEFLESQLKEARDNLSNQEERVREFKSRYLGELPSQVESNVQILAGLQARVQQEMEALAHAKQQAVYLDSVLNQWKSIQQGQQALNGVAQAPPALDQELERLRAEFADLSSRYTPRHPDVRKLKEQIAKTERLKQQMQAQLASTRDDKGGPQEGQTNYSDLHTASPLVEVEGQIKANHLEIDNRQRAIQQLEKQIDEYQARLNMTPLREQQFADITRDYDQSRKTYESLLAKRDQSEMATNLVKRQQGEQFRVLDPPSLPQKPYLPDRMKLNLIGLFAGFAIGGLCLVGVQAADDHIYFKEDLKGILEVAVLTEIPPLPTTPEQRSQRRQHWKHAVAMSVLALLTIAGLAVTYYFG